MTLISPSIRTSLLTPTNSAFGNRIPCWLKQLDYIDTMMSYTLGPIFVMVAIMGIFVINNSDTLFSLKNDEAAVVATSKFTKAQLKEMY